MRPVRRRGRWLRRLMMMAALVLLASLVPVVLLRFIAPPTSAFMLARHWEMRSAEGFTLQYTWVDLERISPQLPIALVAA